MVKSCGKSNKQVVYYRTLSPILLFFLGMVAITTVEDALYDTCKVFRGVDLFDSVILSGPDSGNPVGARG